MAGHRSKQEPFGCGHCFDWLQIILTYFACVRTSIALKKYFMSTLESCGRKRRRYRDLLGIQWIGLGRADKGEIKFYSSLCSAKDVIASFKLFRLYSFTLEILERDSCKSWECNLNSESFMNILSFNPCLDAGISGRKKYYLSFLTFKVYNK